MKWMIIFLVIGTASAETIRLDCHTTKEEQYIKLWFPKYNKFSSKSETVEEDERDYLRVESMGQYAETYRNDTADPYIGTIDDNFIKGMVDGGDATWRIVVNRYSGAYKFIFETKKPNGGRSKFVSYGSCELQTKAKKKF